REAHATSGAAPCCLPDAIPCRPSPASRAAHGAITILGEISAAGGARPGSSGEAPTMFPVKFPLRRRQAGASSALAFLFLLTACTGSGSGSASARTITVGPGRDFATPSAAIASAADGDVVMIDPGQYFDCAVVKASHLTIEGAGPGVVMTDKTCQGKA